MSYRISVIGAGVVGQATGKGFIAHGFGVEFIDVKEDTISKLRGEGFEAFTSSELDGKEMTTDVSVFTVSTPTENGEINLEYLKSAAADLGKRLATTDRYHVVVVRSTVSPGTTEDVIAPIIEEHSGKKRGEGFGLCMNPEYLREVSAEEDFANPWIITIGQLDEKSGDVLNEIYVKYECPKYRLGIKEAEYQKYVHNLFNAVKIGFFNEMREVGEKAGIDANKTFPIVAESCEGMWNARYGTKDLGAFDGMCLPKDTQAFLAWAQHRGWDLPQLRVTIEENNIRLNNQVVKEEAESPELATAVA